MAECVSTDPSREDFPRVSIDQERCLSSLDVLADAALSSSVQDTSGPCVSNMSLPFSEFRVYFHGQPQEAVKGMWDKAVELVSSPGKIPSAPGCDPTSKIVASHRFKDRPHLVTKGKANGEYRCEKNCPHWNGIKICSHTISLQLNQMEISRNFWCGTRRKEVLRQQICPQLYEQTCPNTLEEKGVFLLH